MRRISWLSALALLALTPVARAAQTTAPARADPLWTRVLLTVAGALITGVFGLLYKLWDFWQQLQKNKSEAQTEAARLRQKYVNTLEFHARLLRDHMEALEEKLSDDRDRSQMAEWFTRIKDYGARRFLMSKAAFSAQCHYELVFAMSTLYHTSVFFLLSQRMLSLAPLSDADAELSNNLDRSLRAVSRAFIIQDAGRDPHRESQMARDNGLWDTIQNSMGAVVRKEEGFVSYSEFCQMFVDIDSPRRDDHVFMRALDFFGAFDPREDGYGRHGEPLLRPEGAKMIVKELDCLLDLLGNERVARDSAAASPSERHRAAGA